MKTRTSLITILVILNFSTTIAQITTASSTFKTKITGGENPEYITVGSIMPYKVTPYNWGSLSPFMNPSIYKWWLNGNATGYVLLKKDGITALASLPPPNNVYYPDSFISIQWVKTGNYTIRVNEKSMPKPAITSCDLPGDVQTLDVVVSDRPTVTWDGATLKGGCNLDNKTQMVPVIVNGSKEITVTYNLIYSPQTGTPDTTVNLTAIFTTTNHNETANGNIEIKIPAGKYGKYEVVIKGVTDKIAEKCGILSQASDYPSNHFIIAVMPSLETGPIEYVKEL